MEDADAAARRLAHLSLVWYGGGLAFGIALAVLLVAGTIRTILYPIRAVTESAAAIGAGNLDQLVPITSDDELGQLASSFNTMARQLREFRQSHHAQLIRRSRPARRRSIPFPIRCWWSIRSSTWRWPIRSPAACWASARAKTDQALPVVWEPPEPSRQPLARRAARPARVPARRLRQGRRAASGRAAPFLPPAHPAHPRFVGRDAGGGGAAGGHHAVPPAGRGEEQPGGDRQPRVEDAADEHPPGAAPALGGRRGAAAAEAARAAGRRPR